VLEKRLRLGTFFGIDLFVHWTFGLLIAYWVATSWSEGALGVVFSVARLLGVFACVTLHEYGHALTARVFHVPTVDITLLPIGGVARLKHMPRVPSQELLVAVAGPAVNVVIALLLIVGIAAYMGLNAAMGWGLDRETMIDVGDLLLEPSFRGFVLTLLLVNIMLVLFNMIPAFPMDGGRVLRSILAMMMNYRRATFIASRIGVACAILMLTFGLYTGEFMMILIAGFIAFAGMNEARQVDVMESLRGLRIGDVLIQNPQHVSMDTPLGKVAYDWHRSPATVLPVTSSVGSVVGVIGLKEVARAIDDQVDPMTPIGQLADHSVHPASLDEDLETIVLSGGRQHRVIPVTGDAGELVGMLDLDTLLARGALRAIVPVGPPPPAIDGPLGTSSVDTNPYRPPESPRFDALS